MPPYQYSTPANPYTQSIGELLARRGDIDAQRAQQIGQAQAQAAQARGQAWGGAVQSVGSILGNLPQQMQQQKRVAQEDELRGLQLGETKRNLQARTVLGQVVSSTPHVDEDGVSLYDIPTISSKLEAHGYGDHVGDVATQLKGLNDAFRTERQAKLAVVQRGAQALLQANADPDLTSHFLDTLDKNGTFGKGEIDHFRQIMAKDPTKTAAILRQLAGPEKITMAAPGSTPVGDISGQQMGATLPEKAGEGDYTINGQRFRKDGTPIGQPVASEVKAGTVEDWVSRSRRLAVAQNGGTPLSDQQLQQVDTKALQEYKESNADPEVRAATLAQKNLAMTLAQMQQSQQPTKEQASDVAADVVAHRIAPEQLSSMFGGFGAAGQSFKRMVYAEAKKLDPEFSFEQASAEFQLAKSPAFQNTVRYMDAAIESIPRLEQTAAKIGNGKFRTLNDLVNAGKQQFNSADLKAFKTDALLVGDEIAKLLQGGGTGAGTSDAKLKQASDLISTSDDVPAIASAVKEIQFLIGNRRKALTRGTYMEGASAPSTTIRAKDPQGNIHEAPAGTKLPDGWVLQ